MTRYWSGQPLSWLAGLATFLAKRSSTHQSPWSFAQEKFWSPACQQQILHQEGYSFLIAYNTGKKKWACGASNLPIGATAASQVAEQEIVEALIK